jgi:hypothetical protein
MEPQVFETLKRTLEKLTKVRDAPNIADREQASVIDVVATLRTLLEQYSVTEGEQALHDDRNIMEKAKDGLKHII